MRHPVHHAPVTSPPLHAGRRRIARADAPYYTLCSQPERQSARAFPGDGIRNHLARSLAFVLTLGLAVTGPVVAQAPVVTGRFVLDGADAKLAHARAVRTQLDERTKGYALLLSPAPVTGEILSWRTADPAKRGSFVFLMLEPTGDVWIAELGHAARKDGRFGVVTELKRVATTCIRPPPAAV